MKESKGVYVTKHNIREDQLNRNYQLYTSKITRDYRYEASTKDAGVQYNYRRDNVICTCRNISGIRRHHEVRYFSGLPKQVYAYQGSRSFTDIGVGSIKAFQRKKVKRIYLPETDDRGVGSSDLSSFISRRTRYYRSSFYDHKKTSSKCVGGVIEGNVDVLHEKLSPIVHTKSGTTSPSIPLVEEKKNVEIGSNTHEKSFVTTSTQIQNGDVKTEEDTEEAKVVEVVAEHKQIKDISRQNTQEMKSKEGTATSTDEPHAKRISKRAQEAERVFSSDSLVQHVHNLEHPSEDKQASPMFVDPMENKLEREYRKMFCTKSKDSKEQKPSSEEKPESEMKSTSVLRRRFEALRRGRAKKEDSKKNAILAAKESSNVSAPSHRDVSIASDPPSLEARSYSNSKIYSPFLSTDQEKEASTSRTVYKKSFIGRKDWSKAEDDDSECQGVKGMFKLWGKKFNLDDEESSPGPSIEVPPKPKDKIPATESESKKEGKKFFFFKKKSKDKTKQPYKQKKGVTAGRCEVGDGLMIKIGAANSPPPEKERKEVDQIPEDYEEMLRKAWLQQFLAQTIESRPSVKIRWNNNAYATSSSTVFEIMENVYKDTGVVFRSKSEVTTGESSYYKSFTKQHVNFVQDIEAWMIPKLIPDKAMPVRIKKDEKGDKKDNIEVRISNHKWFIDKSKAFAQKINVVLHSKNLMPQRRDPSSEYLRIDIPKGFFTDSSSDSTGQMQTSNEEVYKIVEYESPEYCNYLKSNKNIEIGDQLMKDIKVTVSVKDSRDLESKILETVIKRPPIHRDVVIQGSNVYIPKRCNVIGVGIITQKDITRLRKPILKIQDDYSDEESEHTIHYPQNTSKFAESYLQDYYRHWTPLGIDFFSWCVSDTHLQCCSENSYTTVTNQGDGSKSCPNIYDDYQASAVISSCGTSCCSHCPAPWEEEEEEQPPDKCKNKKKGVSKMFNKFKSKNKSEPTDDGEIKKFLPKDSLEVFKRRKIYAASNKSKWSCADDKPYSVPSIASRGAQDTLIECPPKVKKTCYKPPCPTEPKPKKKVCRKHVSLPDCDTMNEKLADQLADKCPPPGILQFKAKQGPMCPKHPKIVPAPICEIPPPHQPCKKLPKPCPSPPKPACAPFRPPCLSPPRSPCSSPPKPRCLSPPISPCPSIPKIPCLSPPRSPCLSPPISLCPSPSRSPCPSPPKSPCSSPPKSPCPSKPKPPCPSPPKSPCPSPPRSPPCRSPKTSQIHVCPPPRPKCPLSDKKPNKCSTPPCVSISCKKPNKCSTPPCASPRKKSPPPPSPPCPTPTTKPRPPPPPKCPTSPPPCPSPPPRIPRSAPPCPPTPPSCPPTPPPCPSPPKRRSPRRKSPPRQKSPPPCKSKTTSGSASFCNKASPSPSCKNAPASKKAKQKSRSPSPRSPKQSAPSCQSKPIPKSAPPCPPAPPSCPPTPPPCPPTPPSCPPTPPPCPSPPKRRSPPRRESPPPCKSKTPHCNKVSPSPSCNKAKPKSRSPSPSSPPQTPPYRYDPCPPRPPPCPKPNVPSRCNSPPCTSPKPRSQPPSSPRPTCEACKKCPSQEFPWPIKNQVSNQSLTCSQPPVEQKSSVCSGPPPDRPQPQPVCSKPQPDCPEPPPICPEPKVCIVPPVVVPKCKKGCSFLPPECPAKKSSTPLCKPPPKVSGIFLKMKAAKKTCSKDCSAWENTPQGPEKTSSEENIFINIKQGTASTEEIREGFNIKVQDEDGRTLYERCDYQKQRPSVLNDMYKSNLHHHTVSTSIVQNMTVEEKSNTEVQEAKSDASVANLIEINFKLKVTQGDKTTEINIGNDDIAPERHKAVKHQIGQTSQEVFMLKDQAEQCSEDVNDKNDINIKIVIKNYKPKKKNEYKKCSPEVEEFTQKISERFQTVSTGYSDVLPEQSDQNEQVVDIEQSPETVFSIHRTTIDLTSSKEVSRTHMTSNENVSEEYIAREPIDLMVSSRSATGKSGTEHSESKIDDISSKKGSEVEQKYAKDKPGAYYSMTDTDDQEVTVDLNNTSDDPIDFNSAEMLGDSLTKEDKKRLLKKVFEKASKSRKMKNKDKLKQLREMLKVILTSDSSDHDEMAVTSNELVKEMTYASLKPNYFRDTDSMNNYYKIDSSVIPSTKCSNVKPNLIYPTENVSQCSVRDSDGVSSDDNNPTKQGCLCSTLAARLNMCNTNDVSGVCCCRKLPKADEETCCDLRTEEDFFLLNYKTIEYIDVETQNSKFICNSKNFSVHSKAISGSIRNCIDVRTVKDTEFSVNNKKVEKTFSPRMAHIKPCEMKKLNRNTILGISDEDKVYLMNAKPTKVSVRHDVSKMSRERSQAKHRRKIKGTFDRPADILQCYETKKAVLEIYAEKTLSDEGEHLVAKLPKFVINKESELERNYGEYVESYKDLKNNFVMMSVNR